MNKQRHLVASALALSFFLQSRAHAAGVTGLPWEGPLQTLQLSLTGPVALAVSLIAITVSGAALIFGGEMNEFARRMIMVVLVIALIVGSAAFLGTLFGIGGAVV